jgi:hypothetical protein
VFVFNTVFVIVDNLFLLLFFHIFRIANEDRQLSTTDNDEAKSNVKDKVRHNEDDALHTNVVALGSGNGKFRIKYLFFFVDFFLYCICLKYRLLFFHLSLLLLCCISNKQVEMRNSEDDALDTNIAKDSGDGMFILQYCFFVTEAMHRIGLKYCFTYYRYLVFVTVIILLLKKGNCITLRMTRWTPTFQRTVGKVCC